MTKDELIVTAFEYLEFNPERFNDQEKMKFMSDLQEWISGKSETISDEVYDFLVMINATKSKAREVVFHNYINEKYGYLAFRRVLDVGAGRMCKFSNLLAKNGAKVTAMDPKIRLTEEGTYKLEVTIGGIVSTSGDYVIDKTAPVISLNEKTYTITNKEVFDIICTSIRNLKALTFC